MPWTVVWKVQTGWKTISRLKLPREIMWSPSLKFWKNCTRQNQERPDSVSDNPPLRGRLQYAIFWDPFQPTFIWFPWLFPEVNSPLQEQGSQITKLSKSHLVSITQTAQSNSLKVTKLYNIQAPRYLGDLFQP